MSKRRKRQYYDYYVLRNGKKIDTIDIGLDEVIKGSSHSTYYMLGDKLYCIITYQELDDYYCDIGAITHTEAIRICLGRVALFTNDKKEFEEFKIKEKNMKNFNTYVENLNKSLQSKLFFVNKINIDEYDLIVDYGCGSGILLQNIATKVSDKTILIGFDTSKEMINYCNNTIRDNFPNKQFYFTSNWNLIQDLLYQQKKNLIIFSSVLHETPKLEQKNIYNNIMPLFDTIVIRDMHAPLVQEENNDIEEYFLKDRVPSWQLNLFKQQWGKINNKEKLYRFFLMNEFIDNFETEVKEDYFNTLWDKIEHSLEKNNYTCIYERSYCLKYRYDQVLKRFDYSMCDITHREVIYNKKGETTYE